MLQYVVARVDQRVGRLAGWRDRRLELLRQRVRVAEQQPIALAVGLYQNNAERIHLHPGGEGTLQLRGRDYLTELKFDNAFHFVYSTNTTTTAQLMCVEMSSHIHTRTHTSHYSDVNKCRCGMGETRFFAFSMIQWEFY